MRRQPTNQILTFSVRPYFPKCRYSGENSGISRNVPIPKILRFTSPEVFTEQFARAQARANLSAILAEKQTLINKAIPGFTMKEDSILIVERTHSAFFRRKKQRTASSWRNSFRQPMPVKWVMPNRKNTSSGASENIFFASG